MLPAFLTDPTLVPFMITGLAVTALVLLIWTLVLHVRLARLARGAAGASLEQALQKALAGYQSFETYKGELEDLLRLFDARIKTAARGVSTVRFDAFSGSGSGGHQSFAVALVSESGDGIVLSSMHAREHTRVFAKPITQFASAVELTEEEATALQEARAQTTRP